MLCNKMLRYWQGFESNFNPVVSYTRAACGARGRFVRPAMVLENFRIINICIIYFIHWFLIVRD